MYHKVLWSSTAPDAPGVNAYCGVASSSVQVAKIRPYCFGAVLRGVNFTETSFKSFIDLQDKLHHTVAR